DGQAHRDGEAIGHGEADADSAVGAGAKSDGEAGEAVPVGLDEPLERSEDGGVVGAVGGELLPVDDPAGGTVVDGEGGVAGGCLEGEDHGRITATRRTPLGSVSKRRR